MQTRIASGLTRFGSMILKERGNLDHPVLAKWRLSHIRCFRQLHIYTICQLLIVISNRPTGWSEVKAVFHLFWNCRTLVWQKHFILVNWWVKFVALGCTWLRKSFGNPIQNSVIFGVWDWWSRRLFVESPCLGNSQKQLWRKKFVVLRSIWIRWVGLAIDLGWNSGSKRCWWKSLRGDLQPFMPWIILKYTMPSNSLKEVVSVLQLRCKTSLFLIRSFSLLKRWHKLNTWMICIYVGALQCNSRFLESFKKMFASDKPIPWPTAFLVHTHRIGKWHTHP